MSNKTGEIRRHIRPIPNRPHIGPTTYDAKDPDTKLPPIEPLRPPQGMVRTSLDGGVVPDHHGMASPASRRDVLAGSAAAGAMVLLRGDPAAAVDGKKTFTILHTNDLHSNLIGMGPSSDYAPDQLNEDKTRGGFARLATLITKRKAARTGSGSRIGT